MADLKFYQVTVKIEEHIFVAAESEEEAERVARVAWQEDVRMGAEPHFDPWTTSTVPDYADGSPGDVYMPDGSMKLASEVEADRG